MNESLNIVIIASLKEDLQLKFPKAAKTDGSSDKNM